MKTCIIIGLTPQGLSVLRLLSRAGVKVIAFTGTKNAVGYYSKYGQKLLFSSIEDLKNQISIITKGNSEKVPCFITSGELLASILSEFPELYDICDVQSGPYALVRDWSQKNLMYEYAKSRGLYCAKFQLLNDYVLGELKFPVILKRNFEIPLFFKTKKISSEEELSLFIRKIKKEDYKHVIVQEFINIQDYRPITYQAYFRNGTAVAIYMAFQERKLSTGITSYLEEIREERLEKILIEIGETFFKGSSYNGFAELEFLYNSYKECIVFMEINTRPCGTSSVFTRKFKNFADVITSENQSKLQPINKKINWINIARDIKVRLINRDFRNLQQFFTSKYDILDYRDLRPFVYQFFK